MGKIKVIISDQQKSLKLPTGIMLPEYNPGVTIDEKWTAMIKYF